MIYDETKYRYSPFEFKCLYVLRDGHLNHIIPNYGCPSREYKFETDMIIEELTKKKVNICYGKYRCIASGLGLKVYFKSVYEGPYV